MSGKLIHPERLEDYSTEALVKELQRRRYRKERTPKPIEFCDDCHQFQPWADPEEDAPKDYNPCSMGHKMSFKMPDQADPLDRNYGFFRRNCSDHSTDVK